VNAAFDKRLFLALLLLSVVTLSQLGAEALDRQDSPGGHAMFAAGVILIALIKVRIIIREFMEVRHAPALLCRLTDLWVVVTAVCLIGGHLLGTSQTVHSRDDMEIQALAPLRSATPRR
jgi:hypothetical protein